jgi:cobalt-precorrin 5A hydrolase
MTTPVAVGVGCRGGCSADAIEAIVREALQRVPEAEPLGLFTIHDKRGEAGLAEAAGRLHLDLIFLPREALREQAPLVQTRSIRAETLFGVLSVAEAAALAGAGANPELIVARIAGQGATCAVARSQVGAP